MSSYQVRKPTAVDEYVGIRIRRLRREHRIILEVLAEAVGCSTQQMRKYEAAENRISAGMLARVGKALGKSPSYFFKGYKCDADESLIPQLIDTSYGERILEANRDLEILQSCVSAVKDVDLKITLQSLIKIAS